MRHEKRDNINFYNGDNMEFMKNVPDKFYDLAIVDPEFGIGIGNSPRLVTDKGLKAKEWDKNTESVSELLEMLHGWDDFTELSQKNLETIETNTKVILSNQ